MPSPHWAVVGVGARAVLRTQRTAFVVVAESVDTEIEPLYETVKTGPEELLYDQYEEPED